MLPFLKDRHEGSMSGSVDPTVKIGGDSDYGMIDAIVEDMLEAFQKKDKKLLKAALQALVEHVQEIDADQDEDMLA